MPRSSKQHNTIAGQHTTQKMKKEKDGEGQISPFLLLMLMYSEGEIFKAFLSPSTFPLSPNLESCTHAYFPFTHFQFLKIFPLLRRPPPPHCKTF